MYIAKSLTVALIFWLLNSHVASGEEHKSVSAIQVQPVPDQTQYRYTLETDPLFFAGFLAPKGGYGISLGLERMASENIAVFARAGTIKAGIVSAETNNELDQDGKTSLVRLEEFGTDFAQVGGRYYFSGRGHSWYAGPSLAAQRFFGTYTYEQQSVVDEVRSLSIGANGGYRWNWQSGLSLRLGGSLGGVVAHDQSTNAKSSNEKSAEAEDKVRRSSNSKTTGSLDVSLGYRF
jgi:hypothetical protein